MRSRRISILTSGHLSTCPRMVKAADALAEDGHDVRVVATLHEPWAVATDEDVRSRRAWRVATVDYRRENRRTYLRSGIRHRAARAFAGAIGPSMAPFPVIARAFGRVHDELVGAACAETADFIYGGTTGALAAVAEAARRQRIPYAIDFEDLHRGETAGADATLNDALAARVETRVAQHAAFITTSSEAIANAYRDAIGIEPAVIHNTFPMPPRAPEWSRTEPGLLRAYWFSQTIGPGRGLEDAVAALGRCGARTTLTLRGRPQDGYLQSLGALAARQPAPVTIVHEPPAPPDAMIDLARGFDVGLALEQMTPLNRQLCLTNKAFTYMLAGVAVAIADTPGQHALGVELGRGAALVPPGDVDALARAFTLWARDPAQLGCAKRTAWQSAAGRWHWEHELERGRLCALVKTALA